MKQKIGTQLAHHSLFPEEKLQRVKTGNTRLSISLPKETGYQENRICLTPSAVGILVNNGHEVTVQSGAGDGSKFTDRDYNEAGAKIVYSAKEAFECDLILKVEPPNKEEIGYMKPGQKLISAIQFTNLQPTYIKALNDRKITSMAFELIQNEINDFPFIRAMSEIAGSTVMLIAAEYLSDSTNGQGVILGGITGVPPTKVMILGAGTVAEFAARTALGLGAEVRVFDNQVFKLRRLKNTLGMQLYTSTLDTENLAEEIQFADVVIGALRPEYGRTPCVVTEHMVSSMKPGSVIVDVSIDGGGCFETSEVTSHDKPVFEKHEVTHYCVPNIASRVSRTATMALSNLFTPLLLKMGSLGGLEEMMFAEEGILESVYTYKGNLTNQAIARKFNMKCKDLNLLMAAGMR